MSSRSRAAIAAALLVLCEASAAAPLTPREEAGRKIYFEGESLTGSVITAVVASDGTTVPASVLPCASCHGEDGLGRPEGAVNPSDVRWSSLTRRGGRTTAAGRRHPPYDDRSAARAIESGLDPASNALDLTMPRFTMSREDMESLIAFMKKLEHLRDPGVLPRKLRLATVLPTKGSLGETGQVIRKMLQVWFEDVNAGGGIHGRSIELAVAEYDSDREDGLRSARRLAVEGAVFALVAPFTPRAEVALGRIAEEHKLPIVGLVTPFTQQSENPNRWVFYVLSGVREQARVLADHAATSLSLEGASVAILHPAEDKLADAAAAARAQFESHGRAEVASWTLDRARPLASLATDLKAGNVGAVLFLGSDAELSELARAAQVIGWTPFLLVPGALAARAALALPAAFQGKLFLAYSTLPSDATSSARAHLVYLQELGHVPQQHLAAQVQACSAAAVVAEALKRTGRAVRRESFVGNLEVLYQFETGLVPPVSYGPNRRVGALGAYVVTVDLQKGSFHPVTGWLKLD